MKRIWVAIAFGFVAAPFWAQQEPLTGWSQQGRVEVTAIQGWGVAVGLDSWTKEALPDGVIDRLYLLQAYGPKPAELPIVLERATVLETESGLRVVAENEKVDLRLELASGDGLFGPQGATGDGVLRYRGFGLSRRDKVSFSSPLEASFLALHPALHPRALAAQCDSGGTGASSCSVENRLGGCSVSCSSGYYACCSNAGFATAASCACYPATGGGAGGGTGGGGSLGSSCRYDANGFCAVSCMSCFWY